MISTLTIDEIKVTEAPIANKYDIPTVYLFGSDASNNHTEK